MSYQFFELDSQYQLLKGGLEKRLNKLFQHKQFIQGPEVLELEQKLEEYLSVPYVFAVNSGTSALLIALMALDLKPGDEVITSPLSFGSTATSILFTKATPVFVDIEEETGLMKAESIEQAVNSKTRAILPVSLYGQTADMDSIKGIAKKYNLKVIEDACQSFGAFYKGQKSGTLSDFSSFSFFPAKALGAYGNAGCVVTQSKKYAEKIRVIRNNGQSERFVYDLLGFNALMNSFQALVLLEKFSLFEKELKLRQKLADRYDKAFEDLSPHLKYISVKADRTSSRAYYIVKSKNRAKIMEHFHLSGRPLTIHYPTPLFAQRVLKNHCKVFGDPHKTRKFANEIFSLPLHPYLKEKDQDKIIHLLKEAVC